MDVTGPGFRLLAGAEQYGPTVAAGLEAGVDQLRASLGDQLCAVVLTGSLARGQGAVLDDGDGAQLLSDIDLYAVVTTPAEVDRAACHREVASRLAQHLGDTATLDLGLVPPDWLARPRRTLPARQMAHGARVLYESGQEWSPPRAATNDDADVDPDDAALLWFNRAAEHLLARTRPLAPDQVERFHRWKVAWDAPLAFLASYGHYHPDRPTQWQLLEASSPPQVRTWMEGGVARLRSMWAAMHAGPLTTEELIRWGGVREGDPDGHREMWEWAWPFLRATLRRGLGAAPETAFEELQAACEAGPPGTGDGPRLDRWLRRRGRLATLREARRWAPLSRLATGPWWRYGGGGSGPERVMVAAARRMVHDAHWSASLRGPIPAGRLASLTDDAAADRFVGTVWSDWIMGGSRE